MQFNETNNLSGIIQQCEKNTNLGYTTISGDSTKLKEFTNNANITMNKLWHSIFEATGSWEYDDANSTDLPQATANLVLGTQKYALPTGALTVKRVEIKDEAGNWVQLLPLIRSEITQGIDSFLKENGQARYYRLLGETIELFPASNYNSTGGLKVYFDRGSVQFVSTDTTKTPGFVSEYHYLVGLGASLEWLKIHLPADGTTIQFKEDYAIGVQQLTKFYNARFSTKKKRLGRIYQTFK